MGYAINLLCNFIPVIILIYVNEKAYLDATKYEEQIKEIHMKDTVKAI